MTQQITVQVENFIETDERAFGLATAYPIDSIPGPSAHVKTQFPEYVADDHPAFLELMELYYKWMESYRNVLYDSHRLLEYQDIDTTIDIFAENFFQEFLVQVPRSVIVDKSILLKNIKQFYRARGTEKSYKLFFRLLYNASVSFYYPRVDILKVSDGKWVQNKTIRVRIQSGSAKDIDGNRIIGKESGASGYVERVFAIQVGPITAYELVFNNSSLNGTFIGGETVTTENGVATAIVGYLPSQIKFRNSGKGYTVGETVQLLGGEGRGAIARITNVDVSGAILETTIDDYGIGYDPAHPMVNKPFASNTATEIAYFDVTLGTYTNHPGYYLNEDGQLSSSKFLHDGDFYQQFSYVTRVNESTSTYKDLLLRTLHPAGFKFYGSFSTETKIPAAAKAPTNTLLTTIHHQLFPYIQSPLTGTISYSAEPSQSGTQVVGSGTQFLKEVNVGDVLVHPLSQEYRAVLTILSDTLLIIDSPFGPRSERDIIVFKHNGTGRNYPKTVYQVGQNKKEYNFFQPAVNARTSAQSETKLIIGSQARQESQELLLKISGTQGTYTATVQQGNISLVELGMSLHGENITRGTKVVQKLSPTTLLLSKPLTQSLSNAEVNVLRDGSYPLGATYASVYRHKFQFKPVAWYDENVRMLGDNQLYYGDRNDLSTMKAQTPISVFDQLFGRMIGGKLVTPYVMESNPKLGTNLMPDAVVTQIHKDRDPSDPASRIDVVTIASLESFGDITVIK